MPSVFDNLCGPGKPLRPEPPERSELEGLTRASLARLIDARKTSLSLESRFDLAYNAAHGLCLAALRHHGYRSNQRYIVFQLLPDTPGLGPEVWRVLAKCHDLRNRAEYEGALDVDERIVTDLLSACDTVRTRLDSLVQP